MKRLSRVLNLKDVHVSMQILRAKIDEKGGKLELGDLWLGKELETAAGNVFESRKLPNGRWICVGL